MKPDSALARIARLVAGAFIIGFVAGWAIVASGLFAPPAGEREEVVIIEDKIALVRVEGFIGDNVARALADEIESIGKDPNVKGVLLYVNSEGGTASACYSVYSALDSVEKPVVAYIEHIGASGGYLVSLAADAIVASPFAEVAGVGATVFVGEAYVDEPPERKVRSVPSGTLKDPLSDYYLSGDELEYFRKIAEDAENIFRAIVLEKRGLPNDFFDAGEQEDYERYVVAEGGVLLAHRALALGLIDRVGTYDTARETIT
ncbi:hypothetical protein DRJ19_02640, partial [Candidatus Woesearchaeota archaeon]